jgi:hypothetical protein
MPQTAAEIVTLACQIAKCPGFVSQGQQLLNRWLETLAQNYDFPSAAYTFHNYTIGVNAGTGPGLPAGSWYNLELPASSVLVQSQARYLRTHSVFYNVSGTIFYLAQIPLQDYDSLFQGQGISNYPYWYASDTTGAPALATAQMAFYPPPQQQLQLTIRNQYQPNDITDFTGVPWFPNQDILIDGTAMGLMRITGDKRYQEFYNRLHGSGIPGGDPGTISRQLKLTDDVENFARRVQLDRRYFKGAGFNLPPTKFTGF